MFLSIVTINRNDAKGLQKTLDSVAAQAPSLVKAGLQIEHVIVDGASTDNSVEVARQYAEQMKGSPITVNWISEPDKGIYNAMNKGIRMATGGVYRDSQFGRCFSRSRRVRAYAGCITGSGETGDFVRQYDSCRSKARAGYGVNVCERKNRNFERDNRVGIKIL